MECNYSSLHGHTDYSNIRGLDSTTKVSELFDRAYNLGLNAVAITDHDCLSSFIDAEHYLAKKRKDNPEDVNWQKMKFIRGNEIYLTRNGLSKDNFEKGVDRYFHFILLARDEIGYKQLVEISSRAWGRSYSHFMMRVPTYYQDIIDIIGKNPGHVVGSTACLGGQMGQKFASALNGDISYSEAMDFSVRWVSRMIEIFGEGNIYLEMQPGVSDEQVYVNRALIDLSSKVEAKLIITTDHHYTAQGDRDVHRAYLTSQKREREVDAFYEATYMMDVNEIVERMRQSYDDDSITYKALATTNEIADSCQEYSLLRPLEIPYIPTIFDLPLVEDSVAKEIIKLLPATKLYLESDEPANRQLIARVVDFMKKPDQGSDTPRYKFDNKNERMNRELQIAWDSGQKLENPVHWSRYLLQVSDYLQLFWTKGDSIIAPSRGSAGASYLAHSLDINQIDPTRETAPLVFERFMNPERASVLDIDIDVESYKRDQCIQALVDHYGEERVTRVATFSTEGTRSAIITAGRAIGVEPDERAYIASLCKSPRGMDLSLSQMYYGDVEEDLAPVPEFVKQMNKNPQLWEVAQGIEGLIKGIGSHAGGVIITEKPITHHCGIMKTTSGDIVTSFDLHKLEDLSLIKIDALATKGLSKIRTAMDLLIDNGYIERKTTLRATYEKYLGVYSLERNEPKMWEMVHNNKIISLFQMEQQSGIQGIALTKPTNLEDLATLNSVIRLQPPDKQSERPLEKFARYKEFPEEWDSDMNQYGLTEDEKQFLHKMFDYSSGIAAQQEDLYNLMTSERIVGYGFGRADVLRKAVAKKSPQDFKDFEAQFWKDVEERKTSPQLAKYIWYEMVVPQAG